MFTLRYNTSEWVNAWMERQNKYVSLYIPMCVCFCLLISKNSGLSLQTAWTLFHTHSHTHACLLKLSCVSVSASLAYTEKRDQIGSGFSILIHAHELASVWVCVCVHACTSVHVFKRVKPGVSHGWRDMKEQGILCRKGLLTHARAFFSLYLFILSSPHIIPCFLLAWRINELQAKAEISERTADDRY